MTWDIEYGGGSDYEYGRIEGDGFTVRIMHEEDSSYCDPREHTNVGHMLCAHPNYNLGDEQAPQPFSTAIDCPRCGGGGCDPERFQIRDHRLYGYVAVASGTEAAMEALLPHHGEGAFVAEAECSQCKGEGEIILGIYDYIAQEYGATVVIPLFLYDHSGITMSCGEPMGSTQSAGRFMGDSAGWDTSHVGFIFDTPKTREETGVEPGCIIECLEGEVKEYASWLEGDVYYVTTDIEGNLDGESCGGFIGSEWAEETAKEFAGYAAETVAKERAERAEMAARDIVTV